MRVVAPSRLHFGLLNLVVGSATARRFGGSGLMIDAPGIELRAVPAAAWSAEGPLAGRVLAFARTVVGNLLGENPAAVIPPHHFVVEHAAPEHVGLGTGTQLGLAVGRLLTTAAGLPEMNAMHLARLAGRGARSALGIHGFAQGGFLVEGGKRLGQGFQPAPTGIAPLVARIALPDPWRVVLVIPPGETGLHGVAEQQVFQKLSHHDREKKEPEAKVEKQTDVLCRLVLLGMLPALADEDIDAFGEAVHEFNFRAGEVFAPIQGGRYASSRVAALVDFVRRLGVKGVGQSSWGPAVFAFTADADQGDFLMGRIRKEFGFAGAAVRCAGAANAGAVVETS